MFDGGQSFLPVFVLTFAMSFAALLVVATTSFVKISVVMFLVRNALGIQQTPPNLVLYAIALILTAYISAPVLADVYETLDRPGLSFETIEDLTYAFEQGVMPVKDFMVRFTHERELAFFASATAEIWDADMAQLVDEDNLAIITPAFLITELKRAFEIGFLIYLPFVVIDLVVTTILMAMGMMMVAPTIISTPFKLLLFVGVDGWSRLVHGLVLSYA